MPSTLSRTAVSVPSPALLQDLPRLWACVAVERAGRPEASPWHFSPMHGHVESAAKPCEHTLRLPGPMNLELVADQAFRSPGFFCEGRHGWVGHCEVPPSKIRAVPPANGAASDGGACIWVIEKGHLALELPSGLQARFGPGTVLLWDSTQLPRGQWEHARFSYVRLSPLRHRQVVKHAAFPDGRQTRRLEQQGLGPFLAAQLQAFGAHASTLSPADLAEVVNGIVNVAEALLKAALAPSAEQGASPQAARLQAVHRYIDGNLHRSDLSVADIARETSMSRAQLYRLFGTQSISVQGTLREKRLQKSLGYLKQPQNRMQSIGAIAHACGFSDPSAFSKMFRQRFNLAPREVRIAPSVASPPLPDDARRAIRRHHPA